MPDQERALHDALMDATRQCQRLPYNPTYALQMAAESGPVGACKRLLEQPEVSDGFTRLRELSRLDLSVEAVVLRPEFALLFTDKERAVARQRLAQVDYTVPDSATIPTVGASVVPSEAIRPAPLPGELTPIPVDSAGSGDSGQPPPAARPKPVRIPRGYRNSSITRVRPFFRKLFSVDTAGRPWLSQLLEAVAQHNNCQLAADFAQDPGKLLPKVLEKRNYRDKVWRDTIALEHCFESRFPPPERFLLWLINNPQYFGPEEANIPPADAQLNETAYWRARLFNRRDSEDVATAQEEARTQLVRHGVQRSMGEWWAFEGKTDADCYLETESLLVFFEGKRDERISRRTEWVPRRNQLGRNLEVLANVAASRGKRYGLILLTETRGPIPNIEAALPHLDSDERHVLRRHYLGCLTWLEACEASGLDFSELPDTINDAKP